MDLPFHSIEVFDVVSKLWISDFSSICYYFFLEAKYSFSNIFFKKMTNQSPWFLHLNLSCNNSSILWAFRVLLLKTSKAMTVLGTNMQILCFNTVVVLDRRSSWKLLVSRMKFNQKLCLPWKINITFSKTIQLLLYKDRTVYSVLDLNNILFRCGFYIVS